jgi:uncharacterized membrane protein
MLTRFWRDSSANMGVMFAVAITLGLLASTLVVDAGSLYYERRQMQSAVDLAAIAAASDLSKAQLLAHQTLIDSGQLAPDATTGLTVTLGRYDTAITDPAKRFVPGTQPYNAVDVSFTKKGTLYFGQSLIAPPTLQVSGAATRIPEASFYVGSRLASLNDGLANSLLGGLLGTTVSLKVADYNSLIGAQLELLSFLDALAQEMDVSVGTYSDLLAMEATAGQISRALTQTTTGLTKSVLDLLNQQPRSSGADGSTVPLNNLISVGRIANMALGDARGVAGLKLSAMELLGAAASVSNGARVIDLGLDAGVPGLASLQLALAVGDPPNKVAWFQLGPVNTIARTAQIRLYLKAELLGGLGLLQATVSLPLWIDVAYAEANLNALSCPSAAAPRGSAVLNVTPGIAHVGMSDLPQSQILDLTKKPVAKWTKMIDVLLLSVSGRINLAIGQTRAIPLSFSSSDIANGTIKSAKTSTIVGSVGTAILTGLELRVDQLPLLGVVDVITGLVRALIMPLAPTLDMTIDGLLSLLGVKLGEADVKVLGVRCAAPSLIR